MQRRASPIAGVGVVVAALGLVALAWSGAGLARERSATEARGGAPRAIRRGRPQPAEAHGSSHPGRQAAALLAGQPIDINDAGIDELMLLPRIGPTLARRIVDDRHAHGPYARLEDLARRVSGIGPKTVAGLRGLAQAAHGHARRSE